MVGFGRFRDNLEGFWNEKVPIGDSFEKIGMKILDIRSGNCRMKVIRGALKEPLGFTRKKPPSATCISRSLAQLSLQEFRQHFAEWLVPLLEDAPFFVAAVDGKTSKQGLDENGNPEVLLNVFLQNLKLALTQFPVGETKSNEPGCLKQNLDELLSLFPVLQLLTGDAIYLQRPLLEALRERGVDYLFRVKDNQPDTIEALETCFAEEHLDAPVKTVEKKRT